MTIFTDVVVVDTGKYAAIGAAIAVVGLVFIAVMAFFIMKQK